ncbi:multicopper oxidase domain-containing protein [Arthrobacter alpinus]|nr:multicopper oxidase domain-containing protein [Arthrobacter alpinus]
MGYNGALVAPTIRAKVGDLLDATVSNGLTETTSIHWHGLALRNNDDGVPGLTQQAIGAGKDYSYKFALSHPGTYWYHSHVEMQRERALYGALIIDDPQESLQYDKDWVIVLDDWFDGVTGTPEEVLAAVSKGMPSMGGMDHGSGSGGMVMGHMLMGATSDFLGATPETSPTRSISSTDGNPATPRRSRPSPVSESGCASSTPPATPPHTGLAYPTSNSP